MLSGVRENEPILDIEAQVFSMMLTSCTPPLNESRVRWEAKVTLCTEIYMSKEAELASHDTSLIPFE